MLVSDVLHTKGHEVAKILSTAHVSSAMHELWARGIGALVVEDRWMKMVGLFSERDVVNGLARHGTAALEFEVQRLMTSPIVTCSPSDRIDGVLAMMTLKRLRHMPVMSEGGLVGLVSIGDLVKHRLDEKEREASVLLDIARMRA